MELEHAFTMQWSQILGMQLLLLTALLMPGLLGRNDIYRAFVSRLTSYVVSFAPVALLIYALYNVTRLQ